VSLQLDQGTEAHLGRLKARIAKLRKLVPAAQPECKPNLKDLMTAAPGESAQEKPALKEEDCGRGSELEHEQGTPQNSSSQLRRVSASGKMRLNLLDLAVQARDLKSGLLGMRLSNIYDFDSKTVVFKLGGSSHWSEEAGATDLQQTDADHLSCPANGTSGAGAAVGDVGQDVAPQGALSYCFNGARSYCFNRHSYCFNKDRVGNEVTDKANQRLAI